MKRFLLLLFIVFCMIFSPAGAVEKNEINVLYTIDNNYCIPALLSISSMLKHNDSDSKYCFYIVEKGLTDRNKKIMRNFIEKRSQNVYFVNIDIDSLLNKAVVYDYPHVAYISNMAMARLFASDVLPKDIDKILYLDADTLILSDIKELYDVDLGKYYAGLVLNNEQKLYQKKFYDFKGRYFNSGVILMDLQKWRMHNLAKVYCDFYTQNIEKFTYTKNKENDCFRYGDQDLINLVLSDKILELDLKWNQQIRLKCMDGIVHYITKSKPWKINNKSKKRLRTKKLYMDNWNKVAELKRFKMMFIFDSILFKYREVVKISQEYQKYYLAKILSDIQKKKS